MERSIVLKTYWLNLITMKKYNKLVRDNIPDIIMAKGEECLFHIADKYEYKQKLIEKLVEQSEEFTKDESIEKMASIFEVIDAICAYKGFEKDRILEVQAEKRIKRGGFDGMIVLDES